MFPAIVGRQHFGKRGEEIVIAAGAQLYQRDPRGGMGNEHVKQAVTTGFPDEFAAFIRDVVYCLPATSRHPEHCGPHSPCLPRDRLITQGRAAVTAHQACPPCGGAR